MTILIASLSKRARVKIGKSEREHVVAGINRTEAIELDLRFYLGPLCPEGHQPVSDKVHVPRGSLMYRRSQICVQCAKKHSSKQSRIEAAKKGNYSLEAEDAISKARHSLDDIRMAKEMGITVAELLG